MVAAREAITLDTVDSAFTYLQEYRVLVCTAHGYAVRELDDHLKRLHRTNIATRREILAHFEDLQIAKPADVPQPPPLEAPFSCLAPPKQAFICDEEECNELSISRDVIRKHCNRVHDWKASPGQRTYWHPVWVQTFFNAAGLQRYFTVDYQENDSDIEVDRNRGEIEGAQVTSTDREATQVNDIIQQWNAQNEKHRQTLEIAERETAKTDYTAWFNRVGWPEHLAGCNLRHLSRLSRLPDRDERLLQRAVELNSALVERCVAGLSSLDRETRRWLRSAKLSEPDQRPFARLQNSTSQQTYTTYMSRLLCYSIRVLKSLEDQDRLVESEQAESASSSSESTSGSGDDTETDTHAENASSASSIVVDVFKDARRLYPWEGQQKQLLQNVVQSIERGREDQEQQKALLAWYKSIIFQNVRGDVFVSAILHFLAVLGIDEEMIRLRGGNDFSYMLAGVVYCTRVLAVEIILPGEQRDAQGHEDDRRFRTLREEYLADGSYSVMSKMISILAYGKKIALSHGNAGAVSWDDEKLNMAYRGRLINLARFGKMVQDVITEAEHKLWSELMWTKSDDRFHIPLEKLEDDVTFTKRGISFLTNRANGLEDKRQWMLQQALTHPDGKKLRRGGRWSAMPVKRYLRQVDRFRELLLFCVHVTGGQPARGSEITTVRFRNGFLQDRNVFVIQGEMDIVTRYHKSQSQFDKPKVIPRFLPWRVGQLLAVYLAYVQPLHEHLCREVQGIEPSDYIWSNEFGPWATDRLTRIITRETQKGLGVRLTTLDYRHVAIGLGRVVVGEHFKHGYIEEGEVEEAEVDEEDSLEMSAGRGGEIGANRYGVSLDVIKHLSTRSLETFGPLSRGWHHFLGLTSSAQVGQKRRMDARSFSTSLGSEQEQYQRRIALLMQKNGIGGWGRMIERHQFPDSTQEGDRRGQVSSGMHHDSENRSNDFRLLRAASQATPYAGWSGNSTHSGQLLGPPPPPWPRYTPPAPVSPMYDDQGVVEALSESPLWARSQAVPKMDPTSRKVSEEAIKQAIRKVLRREDVTFRSDSQREALHTIVWKNDLSPLVVVLPTGGGKSLLFMAPACLEDAGVTIVVVPFRALLNNHLATAQAAGIDCLEWQSGEVNPAALVFVSADRVPQFMSYAQVLDQKGLLRRVFVDESHLTFTASNWRAKLVQVRAVRGLHVPTIMLTATLPRALEYQLEGSMAAQMARYIRMATNRPKTRYIVDVCPVGTATSRTVEVCRRMQKHLGRKKGVVYSRSRGQCELLAGELKCAYYHAGAVDNQERVEAWLEHGGLIVATSALGTGVDFPGIVFVLHRDVPYGMIDFAQESGRAGRAGEDVDSVVVVEAGRVEYLAEQKRGVGGVDQIAMDEFITTVGCRRAVMSRYLDGVEAECRRFSEWAQCDRCGAGMTEVERASMQEASERPAVEETLDELVDGCVWCFVKSIDEVGRD